MSHVPDTHRELLSLSTLFRTMKCRRFSAEDGAVVIQNACKGPVCVTRHSHRLLQQYTTNNPLVRLLLSAVQSQLDIYKDGGCLLGTLICALVTRFYESEYHPRLYSQVLRWASQQCLSLLQQLSGKKLEMRVDSIYTVLYGILYSKLSLYMYKSQLQVVVNQLTQVFVHTEGCLATNSLTYMTGKDTKLTSTLYTGVVLDSHHSSVTLPAGQYTCVLVSPSMSTDTDQVLDDLTVVGSSSQQIPQLIIERVKEMVERFAADGVTLCLCQRVIHPQVKLLLQSHGMRYLERIGLAMNRISHLTGLSPYASIREELLAGVDISELVVTHIRHNNDTYLLLNSEGVDCKPTFTIQLCYWTEQVTREIEATCGQAVAVLQVLLSAARLLPGASIWQTAVVDQLTAQAHKVSIEEAKRLGADVSSLRCIVKNFTDSLLAAADARRFDVADDNWHTDTDIQDCYKAQSNAVSTAVSIASAIIQTGHVIRES